MSESTEQANPLFPLYAAALTPEGDPNQKIWQIIQALKAQGYDLETLNAVSQQFYRDYYMRFTTYEEDALFPQYAVAFENVEEPYPSIPLTAIMVRLLAEGYERDYLVKSLTQFMLMLRSQWKEKEEDSVMDVLDSLTHWGNPDYYI